MPCHHVVDPGDDLVMAGCVLVEKRSAVDCHDVVAFDIVLDVVVVVAAVAGVDAVGTCTAVVAVVTYDASVAVAA